VNVSSISFSLGSEECLLSGSMNVSSNAFSLGSEEYVLPCPGENHQPVASH
jgi:hypothetical protein